MPPGFGRVEQHQVQITLEPAVLKTIIQDKDFALQFLECGSSQVDSIPALEVRYVG